MRKKVMLVNIIERNFGSFIIFLGINFFYNKEIERTQPVYSDI